MAGNPRELQVERRKKERERVRKTKRRSKAYIQARPRDLSCDQHVTRHNPLRLIINYRGLNNIIILIHYPIPLINKL